MAGTQPGILSIPFLVSFQISSLKELRIVPCHRMKLTSNHVTFIFHVNRCIGKPGKYVKEVMGWRKAKRLPT